MYQDLLQSGVISIYGVLFPSFQTVGSPIRGIFFLFPKKKKLKSKRYNRQICTPLELCDNIVCSFSKMCSEKVIPIPFHMKGKQAKSLC